MSSLFYATWLSKQSNLQGSMWDTEDAYFERVPIWAFISLSALSQQNGQQFAGFEPHFAYSYIITENTPHIIFGIPNPDKLRDNQVYMTTDHLKFNLQVENVVASAGATIFDMRAEQHEPAEPLAQIDFATHDARGIVIGTHRVTQFEGGKTIDPDQVRSDLLARTASISDRASGVAVIDRSALGNLPFRIDPGTGEPTPIDDI